MIKNLLTFTIGCILLLSCNNASREGGNVETADTIEEYVPIDATTDDEHNAQNSLDVEGVYNGKLPCADCEGIDTEIELKADSTYVIKTKYLGKGDGKTFEEKGSYTWLDGSTIELQGIKDASNKYFVGENTLTHLDMDGNKVTGELADDYILKK